MSGTKPCSNSPRKLSTGAQQRSSHLGLWNLQTDASRATRTLRMYNTQGRLEITDPIVAAAAAWCVPLDGSAAQRPIMADAVHHTRYTSQAILDAEQSLLAQMQ